jgi:hypothetical protein
MFNFKKIFEDKFLLLCIVCIGVIILAGLIQITTNSKGSWSKYFMLEDNKFKITSKLPLKTQKKSTDSKGEIECRNVLEDIFRRPFKKYRPDFLNNPVTGGNFNMELDCYNPELKLAVEYSGKQHYEYVPYFHKNKEAFLNQKYRDELKRRMCKDNMITLIEVPYTVKIEDIRDYLKQKLLKNGYILT